MEPTFDIEEFLKQVNVGILATIGPGSRPHAMPVWYVYEDGRVVITAGHGSQKHRNIERNGEATLVIDRREPPYYAVMVQGKAEIGPPPSEELRLRIASRYLGEERGRAYVSQPSDGNSITIYLQPDRFVEYHGVSGRDESEG